MEPHPEETADFSAFSKMRRIQLDHESVIGRELLERFAEFDESFSGHSRIWAVVVKLIGLTAMCSKAVIDLEKAGDRAQARGAIPRQGVSTTDRPVHRSRAITGAASGIGLGTCKRLVTVDQRCRQGIGVQLPDCAADRGGCLRASAGTARGGFLRRTGRTDPVVNENSMNTTS